MEVGEGKDGEKGGKKTKCWRSYRLFFLNNDGKMLLKLKEEMVVN